MMIDLRSNTHGCELTTKQRKRKKEKKNHETDLDKGPTIDLFTDSDAILNFCPVEFCLKWTLYFVSTSNFMKEDQFSRLFDFGKLFNMSVKVYIFMKALTMKKF